MERLKAAEITELRKKMKLTQERFAAVLCASMVTVNRWEKGHTKPTPVYVEKMRKLQVDYGL